MTHLPDSDLRELEGLLAKGCPPPWFVHCQACQQVWSEPADAPVAYTDTRDNGEGPTEEAQAAHARLIAALPSLIADLREMRERNAWRDIASAPKDGTWIIGYWRSSDVMETVFYSSADTWESVLDNTDAQFVSPPTHWFPLPDAPARIKELESKT